MGIRRPDQSYSWVLINSEPIFRDGDVRLSGVVAIFIDITERVNIRRQLFEAQKLDAIGKLTGGIAHDFRNLLQAMLSSSELLQRMPLDERAARQAENIRKATLRGRELTQQLLAVGQRQILRPAPINAREVVDSTLQLLQASVGDSVKLTTVYEDGLWPIHADPATITQVVM